MVVGLFSGVCFGLRPVCKYFSAKLKHELCLHFSTIVSQQALLPSVNPQITHYSRTTKSHHEINAKVSKKEIKQNDKKGNAWPISLYLKHGTFMSKFIFFLTMCWDEIN